MVKHVSNLTDILMDISESEDTVIDYYQCDLRGGLREQYQEELDEFMLECQLIISKANGNKFDKFNQELLKLLVIKCCGKIEFLLKEVMYSHFVGKSDDIHINKYLENMILGSSSNPSIATINNVIKNFIAEDGLTFSVPFKSLNKETFDCIYSEVGLTCNYKELVDHMDSLRKLRNKVAHGVKYDIVVSAEQIYIYFISSLILVSVTNELLFVRFPKI